MDEVAFSLQEGLAAGAERALVRIGKGELLITFLLAESLFSLLEFTIVNRQIIELVALPARFFGRKFLIWLRSSFLPCRNGTEVKIAIARIYIGKKAAFFRLILLMIPSRLYICKLDFLAAFG